MCAFIVVELIRITRQIHCKAVEQRATLIRRQYNRDWGTLYSRPPIDPYLTPPCYKILAAPVVRDTAKPAVKRRYNKKAATTLSAAVDSISAVLVHSCSKCCSPVARTASDRRSRLSPARHQARTRRLHQSHVTRTRLNCASEPAA